MGIAVKDLNNTTDVQSTDYTVIMDVSDTTQHPSGSVKKTLFSSILQGLRYLITGEVTVGTTGSGANYICDGTNDEVEFNQAVTYVNGLLGGGVRVLPGTYKIQSAYIRPMSNVHIIGNGLDTILKRENTATGLFQVLGTTTTNFSIKGFLLDENMSGPTTGYIAMDMGQVSSRASTYYTIEDVKIINSSKVGITPIASSHFTLRNIEIISAQQSNLSDAINLNFSDHYTLENIDMQSGDDGVVVTNSPYGSLINLRNSGATQGGALRFAGSDVTAEQNHDIVATGIYAEDCLRTLSFGSLITVSNPMYNITVDNVISNNNYYNTLFNVTGGMQSSGDTPQITDIVVSNIVSINDSQAIFIGDEHTVNRVTVSNAKIYNPEFYGVYAQSGFNVTLNNIEVYNAGLRGFLVFATNGAGYIKDFVMNDCKGVDSVGQNFNVGQGFDDNETITINNFESRGGAGAAFFEGRAIINNSTFRDSSVYGLLADNTASTKTSIIKDCTFIDNGTYGFQTVANNLIVLSNPTYGNNTSGNTNLPAKSTGGLIVNDASSYIDKQTIADDVNFIAVMAKSGFGEIIIGDNEEYAQFRFTSAGVVTLTVNSTNVVTTDTDNKFCIRQSGTNVAFKNRLGSSKTVVYKITYF